MTYRLALALLALGSLSTAAASAPPAAPPKPQTQAEVMAQCRAAQQRAGTEARYIASVCAEEWQKLNAALPMARAILGMMARPAATLRTPAGAKAALPMVRWNPRPAAPTPPHTVHQQGSFGALAVSAEGRGAIDAVSFDWNAVGELIPYDVPAAMRYLGARVTPIACGEGGGAFGSEFTRSLRIEMAGVAPFELRVMERVAAVANQESAFRASVRPGAPVPSLAMLRASSRSTDRFEAVQWSAACPPSG